VALEAGAALSMDGVPKAGMGVTAEFAENSTALVILVTNLTREGVTVFRDNGLAEFDDVTSTYGLLQPTFGSTGFGTKWFDYDNDGWLDLFIANGAVTLVESLGGGSSPYAQKKQLFQNEGRGEPFRDTSAIAGAAFQIAEVSRGAAFGDIDNDGALDIVVTNNNGPVRLLRNQVGSHRHWLQVKLEARKGSHFGVGARVAVLRRGHESLWRWVHTDSSYLSASDVRVHFGLGDKPHVQAVLD
jgi:enediyne biosynthesis protein E4